jgi:outer membrane protein OmpA-like peptidoglycan-associated protein
VARNYQSSLKAKGFQPLFDCRGADCSDLGGSELYFALHDENAMGNGDIHPSAATQSFSSWKLSRPEGDVFVAVYAGDFNKQPEVLVDVVETQPMADDKIVFIDATEMQRQIEANGRVSLYGILFDFDKATIRPDSKPTLDEIVKLLKANADLKVVVTGHTDSKGGFDYNVDLSRRRAEAVVQSLAVSGIAGSRLKPFGAGMAAPVATNENEAGRAKNRRVELVKASAF